MSEGTGPMIGAAGLGIFVGMLLVVAAIPLTTHTGSAPTVAPPRLVLRWVPVAPAGSSISVAPCWNFSNASAGFTYCQMSFTIVTFSTNASAYLTGNVSSKLPFVLFVTETRYAGLVECDDMGIAGGCAQPFNGTIMVLGEPEQLFTHVDLSNLSVDNRGATYPLPPGDWAIVIGNAAYPPSPKLVTVTSTIAYSA